MAEENFSETHIMSIEHEELADIFHTVAERLSVRPWDTDIEQALEEIADEIKNRA